MRAGSVTTQPAKHCRVASTACLRASSERKRRAPGPKPRVLLLGVPTPRKITPRGASPCRRCRWHLEFWSGAWNGGCPRQTGRVLTESRILPCRSRTELAIPLPPSRTCFTPTRSTLAARCPQRRTLALIPVRYPGQDASGGGAGYRPRVLKRYYEPVINLGDILLRKRIRGPAANRAPGRARSRGPSPREEGKSAARAAREPGAASAVVPAPCRPHADVQSCACPTTRPPRDVNGHVFRAHSVPPAHISYQCATPSPSSPSA